MQESKNPTVLVAGGAGFIGSQLCEKLLSKNYKVICLDNFITGSKKNIQHLLQNPNFSLVEWDVTKNVNDIKSQITKLNYIFHLASPASPNKKSPKSYIAFPLETLLVNSAGTFNLLQLAREKNGVFLFASSSEIYGDPSLSPQSESYFGNVNPIGPRSVYDESKRFGEALTMAFFRKYGVNARIIRIFNTYGPNMQKDDGRVVSNFITESLENKPLTVYGDGQQTRSFCYVDDMVEGIIAAMFMENTKGEVINLGNPDERKVIDLARLISKMIGSKSEIVFEDLPQDDPSRRKPDIMKAKKLLSWEPKIGIEEGLIKTIQYFRGVIV